MRERLQVAELLNYLAIENHVSTVRGTGLNVSISVHIISKCVWMKVCERVEEPLRVNMCVYGYTLSILVALISHFLPSFPFGSSPHRSIYFTTLSGCVCAVFVWVLSALFYCPAVAY